MEPLDKHQRHRRLTLSRERGSSAHPRGLPSAGWQDSALHHYRVACFKVLGLTRPVAGVFGFCACGPCSDRVFGGRRRMIYARGMWTAILGIWLKARPARASQNQDTVHLSQIFHISHLEIFRLGPYDIARVFEASMRKRASAYAPAAIVELRSWPWSSSE
jgi:hypothetical protein